jgi:polyisoprenoid-binding protein YceI
MRPYIFIGMAALACAPLAHARDTYTFDPAHSSISFTAHQFLGTTVGHFSQCSGTIEIDREHPEHSSVSARIQVKSIDTKIAKRDEHLLSEEFFDAQRYPEITFKTRSVRQTGPESGEIAGDLTMHGVTRSVVLHAKLLTPLKSSESTARIRWVITTEPLKRRDFNLMFSKTAETMSGISQDVGVKLEIEATKSGSP